MNSTGKVLLGILAGAAAGAILGVLLAPDKGSVTRKKILKKGEDYTDALKDKFEELVEGVTEKFSSAREDGREMASKGTSKIEEYKKDAKAAIG